MDVEGSSDGCLYNYVVTAQRPTAVTHAAVGNLTDEHEIDLIVGKSTVIELFTLKREGLQPVLESPVNGRIVVMKIFRQQGHTTDSILLLTEKMKISIIRYDPTIGDWQTISSGPVHQRIGNAARNGPIVFLDPTQNIIGFHLYDGQIRVAAIVNGNFDGFFSIALDELNVLDMCFLSARHLESNKPVMAILHEDTRHLRHLKTYVIDIYAKEMEDSAWFQSSMVNTAHMLIPVHAYGGLMLVGESMISYFSCQNSEYSIPVHETAFECYARIDDERYLLSDKVGHLYMFVLIVSEKVVRDISYQRLGMATPASCISYLDSGIVFLGSKCGDSQLIRLVPGVSESNSLIQELSRFTNLGPIVDFCVVDLERQGQCQIVSCSGAFTQGSLRIIRNGIGISNQAVMNVSGIKGLWSLKRRSRDEKDCFLVISFVNETQVLAFSRYNPEELADAQIPGFQECAQTLHCANMMDDRLLQVTEERVTLTSCESLRCTAEWRSATGILMASSSATQILVASKDGDIVYLQFKNDEAEEMWRFRAQDEVCCLDVTPIGDDVTAATFAAVGTWDMKLHILNLLTQSVMSVVTVSEDFIPRSVLLSKFEGIHYLLVGMGDGRLITYEIDAKTGALSDERRVSIGTKPVTLSRFWSRGTSHVFAASDRPTVIYGDQKKIMFSNLNEQNVNCLTSFDTENAPECLALARDDGLTIGDIDDIQKLHIKSVYLKEMPRRICYQPETRSYGVLVESHSADGTQQSFFRIFDDQTFEVKTSVEFEFTETGTSILSMTLPDRADQATQAPFFIVGTVFVSATDHEPCKGRFLVYSYADVLGNPNLALMAEKDFKGAIFSLKPLQDRILATVNSKVHVVEWKVTDTGTKTLVVKNTQHGHILAIHSDVRNDFVLIGDLMRSIAVLIYNRQTDTLEERAKDSSSNWMTALKALDDDVYLGAENSHNLFTVRKITGVKDDDCRLETVGCYHLGDYVNVLREGSLVANADLSSFMRPPVLFGTVSGLIGMILSLTREKFEFLDKLQTAMRKVISPLGMFDHHEYRWFSNERHTKEAKSFVDGDLIESYLDLKKQEMESVAEHMQVAPEEIYKIVEELSKLH